MLTELYNSLLGYDGANDGVDDGDNENSIESSNNRSENAASGSSVNSSFSSFASPDKASNHSQTNTDPPTRVENADLDDPETCKQILVYLLQEADTHKKDIEILKNENQALRESNEILTCKTLKIIKFAKSMKKLVEGNNEKIAILDKQQNELYEDLSGSINDIKLDIRDLEQSTHDQETGENSAFTDSVDNSGVADDAVNLSIEKVAVFEKELNNLQTKAGLNVAAIQTLHDENRTSKSNIRALKQEMVRLETNLIATNQYNRRENLIIEGIPGHIKGKTLEDTCIDIVREMGFFALTRYEVIGCHRLKKKDADSPAPTIIRFFNRKIVEHCLKNSDKIKNLSCKWNLSFREDLCEANQEIFDKCAVLKEEGLIQKFYTYNGFVKVIKLGETKSIKISHSVDLLKLFPVTSDYFNDIYVNNT